MVSPRRGQPMFPGGRFSLLLERRLLLTRMEMRRIAKVEARRQVTMNIRSESDMGSLLTSRLCFSHSAPPPSSCSCSARAFFFLFFFFFFCVAFSLLGLEKLAFGVRWSCCLAVGREKRKNEIRLSAFWELYIRLKKETPPLLYL